MGTFANIVCKTVGIAGMSAVTYDAYTVGKKNSARTVQQVNADHFERIVADTRTLSSESYVGNAMQKKVAELRMDNPLYPLFGKVKGFTKGFLNTLGDNIVPVALSSLALCTKGTLSKIGAWGLAGYGALKVATEGFGFGKSNIKTN